MKTKYFLIGLLFVLGLACTYSCKKESEGDLSRRSTTGSISIENVDFKSEGGSKSISVQSSVEGWTAKSDQAWCKTKIVGKLLQINVEPNTGDEVRVATITIISGSSRSQLQVRQLGKDSEILIDKTTHQVVASGEPIQFTVTSNNPVTLEYPEWIRQSESRALIVDTYTLIISPNKEQKPRTGTIKITEKVSTGTPKVAQVIVSQQGLANYQPFSVNTIKDDIKIPVVSGTDTSHQDNNSDISKSFDGDLSTLYHSNWNNAPENYFPITLTYNFGEVSDIDYLIYHPRLSGYNGHFKEVDILYSIDGENFTKALTKDFEGNSFATKVDFDTPIKAKSIRFVVRSGGGDGRGFASCAEMEFYRRNPDAFDPRALFTDESCSELKNEVTEESIQKISDPFFKNLVYHMKTNSYQREFRIADFKAWLDPVFVSRIDKTNPYSRLDNATGIYVNNREELLVCVGDTHGYNRLSILVQNLDKPGGDGFNGSLVYPLHKGINKIKIQTKGLVYVLYHARTPEELATLRPIRIHFASGQVNGYFDSQNPKHEGRWNELLNKTVSPYFDVLGKHAHITFPVEDFKRNTPDGKALIDIYDKIVNAEKDLHGLYKYHKSSSYRLPQNRMYLHVMYHMYMYATWYHTAYVNTTMGELTNANKLSTSSIWGPAHEIGHMNQTRPGLLWRGMTECTVNIPSEYVQTYIFKQPSRLQTEDMGGNNRYSEAFTKLIVSGLPFCNAGDVFKQLVPFWQLELYFGKVLGKSPALRQDKGGFYPDVYEYLRTHTDLPDAGTQQTEFPYVASYCAQVDLTDFFEYWGFFRPVDQEIDDYGKGKIIVTESRATEVKNRIKALGYNKFNLAIEYITDHNSDLYKNPSPISSGSSATFTGDRVTIKGWSNVVAFEVYNENNQRIFVADASFPKLGETKFKLPTLMKSTFKIKAISARREVVDVPLAQ